jgi:phosphonate transport system substrate-binding protein
MQPNRPAIAGILAAAVALLGFACGGAASTSSGSDASCPNGGTVRMGVEPFEDATVLQPLYQQIVDALGTKLGCKVELDITTNYTAEVEAMRARRLEVGEFGPLGYVFARRLAGAQPVATFADKQGTPLTYYASIVTWQGSGITTLKEVAGKKFAYSDAASTSGHLYPAYGLKKAGIDPDNGVQALYAGSHTASFEAIRNHKVDAGELNSDRITSATAAGEYRTDQYPTLWKSDPIPQDPIAVRGDLSPAFKDRFKQALLKVDLSTVSDPKSVLVGPRLTPQTDAPYAWAGIGASGPPWVSSPVRSWSGRRAAWNRWAWRTWPGSARTPSPAARRSGWRWPGRCCRRRPCSWPTSRSPASTPTPPST